MTNNTNLSQAELDEIETVTLSDYNDNAESFWQGTKDHDVSQNISAFLDALPNGGALDILDFGCGPGRDLMTFKTLGHNPTGLDGSLEFCRMAEAYSGCQVLNQTFLSLDLPEGSLDGIFCNASLFHVPSGELPQVLNTFVRALRPGGILFTSSPRGNAEGWSGVRYGNYMEFELTQQYLVSAGFRVLDHYYRPQGLPIEQQRWLAVVSQKL